MESIMVLNKWRRRLYTYEELMQAFNFIDGIRGVKKLRGFVLRELTMADTRKDVGFSFIKGEEHVFLKKNAQKLGFVPDLLSKCGAYKKEVN